MRVNDDMMKESQKDILSSMLTDLEQIGCFEFTTNNAERKKRKQDFLAVYINRTDGLRGCTLSVEVGDKIFRRCTTAKDSETIRNMLLELKDVVSVTKLIFITDGLKNYMKPIAELFPEAIHVRRFHNTSEDVLIHFGYEGERYSLHVKSDVLLPSGNKEITLWRGTKCFLNRKSGKKQKQMH